MQGWGLMFPYCFSSTGFTGSDANVENLKTIKKSYRKRGVFVQDDKALNKPRLLREKNVVLYQK
jgi:hypothetical protein